MGPRREVAAAALGEQPDLLGDVASEHRAACSEPGRTAQTFALGPTTGADVQRVLAEIVVRRYPDGKSPTPDHRRIVLQADGTKQLDALAELLGAIRATADGKELFPDVLLSSGFE